MEGGNGCVGGRQGVRSGVGFGGEKRVCLKGVPFLEWGYLHYGDLRVETGSVRRGWRRGEDMNGIMLGRRVYGFRGLWEGRKEGMRWEFTIRDGGAIAFGKERGGFLEGGKGKGKGMGV